MFEMRSVQQQTPDLRRENTKMRASLEQAMADVEYFAMMADIELEYNEETEDTDNEDEV